MRQDKKPQYNIRQYIAMYNTISQDKTRQCKTRQGNPNTRQYNAIQYKARQDKTIEGNKWQYNTNQDKQYRTIHDKTRQANACKHETT